ncbi:MAG: hypothetical protein ABEK84_01910, partial [Salinibacter sp.]
LITTWWKISVHCASVAGAVATLAFVRVHVPGTLLDTSVVGSSLMAGGAILIGGMLWARVRSRAHTPEQAVAGAVLGMAPYGELLILAEWIGV